MVTTRPRERAPFSPPGAVTGGVLALAAFVALAGAPPAAAQFVRPWSPPAADSLLAWAGEARARFQLNRGDSAVGENFRAYELVGRMGRRLLHSLGRENLSQAHAIGTVLEGHGIKAEIAIDPTLPYFAFVLVRNPYRPSAEAVGFLYWYRGEDFRLQGLVFRRGTAPRMRVWWTGRSEVPYQWGILTQDPSGDGRTDLVLLRLDSSGYYWNLAQYEGRSPDFGPGAEAFWVDVNGDLTPEIVSWAKASPDSTFEECQGCPRLFTERIFTEHAAGYELHDSRLLPSPYANFVLFIRLLREQDRAGAGRLLESPARLDEAIALGWAARVGRGAWKLEHAEEGRAWPRWLAFRFQGPKGTQRYVVRFAMRDGRWIIRDWTAAAEARPAPADSAGRGG